MNEDITNKTGKVQIPLEYVQQLRGGDALRIAEEILERFPSMPMDDIVYRALNERQMAIILILKERFDELKETEITKENYEEYLEKAKELKRELAWLTKNSMDEAGISYQGCVEKMRQWEATPSGRDEVRGWRSEFETLNSRFTKYSASLTAIIDIQSWENQKIVRIIEELQMANDKTYLELEKLKGDKKDFMILHSELQSQKKELEQLKGIVMEISDTARNPAKIVPQSKIVEEMTKPKIAKPIETSKGPELYHEDYKISGQIKGEGWDKPKEEVEEELPIAVLAMIKGDEGYSRFSCLNPDCERKYFEIATDVLEKNPIALVCDSCMKKYKYHKQEQESDEDLEEIEQKKDDGPW